MTGEFTSHIFLNQGKSLVTYDEGVAVLENILLLVINKQEKES